MALSPLLWVAAAAAVAGVVVLRLSWGRRSRSAGLNALGWGLFLAAGIAGWASDGAWGASVAALFGMAAASIALGVAAAMAPAGKAPASDERVRMLPDPGEPLRLFRRIVTFLLVVIVSLFVSIGFGMGAALLASAAGWSEANANVTAMFVMPLAWAALAYLILVEPRRRTQWTILLFASVPGLIAVLTELAR